MTESRSADNQLEMKAKIFDAFEELLYEKPYTEITINDICSRAYISKPTFYHYFRNKDNIARWKTKQFFKDGLGQIGRKYTWLEGYTVTTVYLHEHKILFSDPQNPKFVSEFLEYLSSYQKDCIIETITRYAGTALTEKLEVQIEALTIAQSHITRKWSTDGMKIPPETFAEYLASIVPHDLFKLLNEPREKQADGDAALANGMAARG